MLKSTETLDERSRELLALLIKTHVATGEPVGSRVISRLTRQGLSPATVRNSVADLEEAGYLEQPHTSAGRVPSDKGYRFFVDQMLEETHLSDTDEATMHHGLFGGGWVSADHLMSRASHLLSYFSDGVGIVVLPTLTQDIIKHIDFVRLTEKRILVITVTRAGLVQDRVVRIDEDFSQDDLNSTARYLNENFCGMTLLAIRNELLRRLSEEKDLYDCLLQKAILLCERGLRETEAEAPEIFVEGAANMVTKPDFTDKEKIRELLRVFEEKNRLIKILNECVAPSIPQPVSVRIGAENSLPSLRGCAVITSYYGFGDQVKGSLGVVGPVRMEYARMISVVNYVARLLEQALAEDHSIAA
ncbi:MAG: heat-inducible transcription repressor HrcA [Acidobacteria bacterium]|nr:heat-inducible transcription repressor HrcA [Acidobacteriota bacterium]MBI3423383.1 heat-inducible transcription repressor HrcA [Acidobacteriota bacterium]